jgi:hypothetical protein
LIKNETSRLASFPNSTIKNGQALCLPIAPTSYPRAAVKFVIVIFPENAQY